jgi:hypothetical protein
MRSFSLLLTIALVLFCFSFTGCPAPGAGSRGTPSSEKAITAFSFPSLGVIGTINETSHTIATTVPVGTNVTALIATFSTTGTSVKVGSTTQVSGTTANNFTKPVTYTVKASDSSTQDYTVTVTVASDSAKTITAFGFVSPAVTGTITESTHSIAVILPYGSSKTALVATFSTTGQSVKIGAATQTSGVTSNSFSSPVTYTVWAADGSSQDYTVSVTVASNSAKAFAAFGFVSPAVTGTITESTHSIAVMLPYGSSKTALVATFSTTGQTVKIGTATQTSGVTSNSFSSPVVYTVGAADGSSQDYTVSVTVALNTAKTFTAFGFVSPAVSGAITESTHSIAVMLPYGSSKTALVATFSTTGQTVKIGSATQTSGVTSNSFSSPVTYTVAAADGSTQDYVVTVTVALNPAKAITSYSINGHSGIIDGNGIYVSLPYTTDITNLTATFTTTGQTAKIGSTLQTSGVTHVDFTAGGYWPQGVDYTVYAEDGTTQEWCVYLVLGTMGTLGPLVGWISFSTDGTSNIFSNDYTTINQITIATDSSVGLHVDTPPNIADIVFCGSDIYYTTIQGNGIYSIPASGGTPGTMYDFAGSLTYTAGNADGIGSNASFNAPKGIVSDGTYLYVADSGNKSIRKALISSTNVTTLQTSGFSNPVGITLYGSYLYVSDSGSECILRVDKTSGSVTTLAGSGTSGWADGVGTAAQFNGPNQLVCDGTYLYVVDEGNNALRRVTIDTTRADYGRVITLAKKYHGSVIGSPNPNKCQTSVEPKYGITIVGGIIYFCDYLTTSVIRKLQ